MGIWAGITQRIFPEPDRELSGLEYWRQRILSTILFIGVVAAPLVILCVAPMAAELGIWAMLAWDIVAWGVALLLLLFPGLGYKVRAAGGLCITYGVGLSILINAGVVSGAPAWLFAFSILAGVLLGSRAAVAAVCLNALTLAAGAGLTIMGKMDPGLPFFKSKVVMLASGVDFIFLNALAAISVSVMVKGMNRSHDRTRDLAGSLKEKQALLETEVRERREVQAALGQSEEKYRNILESIEDGYFEVDRAGNLTFFNDSLGRILGYGPDDLAGRNYRDFMDKGNAEKVFEAFNRVYRTGLPTKAFGWQLTQKDGAHCFVETVVSLIRDARGRRIGFRGIARDVTDRTRMELRLRQSHKMESIGRLAGGIAHDFNNVLYIIMGNAELAMEDLDHKGRAAISLDRIKNASQRAADIVKQLLDFGRDQGPELKAVDLSALVAGELSFLRSTLPALINVRGDLPDTPVAVMADPVQVRQILINLSANGAQAMADRAGDLEINVEVHALEEKDLAAWPSLSVGAYARIAVRDTGRGIPPPHLEKIFDPYFTTREVGEGAGMGLAVVHGIVRHHGGAVHVTSTPGVGTEFQVMLPLASQMPETHSPLPDNPVRSNRTLMYVDDEKMLVETHTEMLSDMGYEVEGFIDPKQALARFQSDPQRFDCLVTDMTMPGMTGMQLAQAVRKLCPGLPVVVCTGHSDLLDPEQAESQGISHLIAKPVAVTELDRIIQSV